MANKKILIFSNNDVLNELYKLNLEVYTDSEVILCCTLEDGKKYLQNNEVNIILTLSKLGKTEVTSEIQKIIEKKNDYIPVVVIGDLPKNVLNVINVPSIYNLQNIIRVAAKILGVTAKEMAEKSVSPFYELPLKNILSLEKAECDLYLKSNDHVDHEHPENQYILLCKKGTSLNDMLKKMFFEGVPSVYVNARQRLHMINQVSSKIIDILKVSEAPMDKKAEAVGAGFEFVANQLISSTEIVAEILNLSQSCIKSMDEISKEAPTLKSLLQAMSACKENYLYIHSMLASFVAQHIIRKMEWGVEEHIEKVNFVLFFHDIVLSPLYIKYPQIKFEEDILFDESVSEKDKEIVLNHAKLAAELLSNTKRIPMGADMLLRQHHGMNTGVGFANDFKDDISPLAKVVIISEAFVEEFVRFKDENPTLIPDNFAIMSILAEKFPKSTYKKILEPLKTIKL